MDFNKLSVKEKIAQKFMFGINSYNIDSIISLIKNYSIGGVILYKKNYNSYDEMLSVVKRIKDANKDNKLPLFIAIDQEGGRVNRMPLEFKNFRNVYDMSKKDPDLIYRNAKITGKMLSQTGINMNFSPVMDICDDTGSKVLYKRCFYGDVDDICSASMKYVNGLQDNGIIAVPKHFPGHGVSKMDSHFITPYVRDYKKVLDRHILPFENAIKNGIDAIMVNHLVIKNLTDGVPASISHSFIQEYLRKRNNFDGLVITDEMNMLSRNIFYKFSYMKKSFLSGSDIILIKINDRGTKVIDKFIKFVNKNNECMKLVDDSVKRIIRIKDKYKINDNTLYNGCNIDEINEEIDKINNLCS